MADTAGSVTRVRMHKHGPEFSSVIWGSMRSEEQFRSSGEVAEFLRFLLDRGVTTLDTANTYGYPHPYTVEEFLGKAVAEVGRDKFEIVTKCGIQRVSPHRTVNRIRHYDFTEKEIRRSIGRSPDKLGTDYADLILLHRPDYLMDPEETAGTLDALIAEGKTRHVGISNFSPSRYHLLASKLKAPIVTNQVEFSPIHLKPISDGTFDTAIIDRPPADDLVADRRRQADDRRRRADGEDQAGPQRYRQTERPRRARRGGDRIRRPASGKGRADHRLGKAPAHGRCDQGGCDGARPAWTGTRS